MINISKKKFLLSSLLFIFILVVFTANVSANPIANETKIIINTIPDVDEGTPITVNATLYNLNNSMKMNNSFDIFISNNDNKKTEFSGQYKGSPLTFTLGPGKYTVLALFNDTSIYPNNIVFLPSYATETFTVKAINHNNTTNNGTPNNNTTTNNGTPNNNTTSNGSTNNTTTAPNQTTNTSQNPSITPILNPVDNSTDDNTTSIPLIADTIIDDTDVVENDDVSPAILSVDDINGVAAMRNTGNPIAMLLLGFLTVFGLLVINKK